MVTIADVARTAGVSISTVSYVMSGKRSISPQTRARVERAIEELSFSPHASARSLASRATNVIGLQAPLRAGVDVHVVMEIVAGVVREARAHQYDILLLTSDDASGLERATRGSMVDALLLMDVESDDPRIAALESMSTPSVLIGLPGADSDEIETAAGGALCVDFDFEAAGRLAAHRLAQLGHRRVALIGSPPEVLARHTSYAQRLSRGFRDGCRNAGLTASVHPSPSTSDSVRVVDDVLDADPDVTGLLVHNEGALPHIAAHLLARGGGHDVIALAPDDLARSVAGLRETIHIPAEEIGATAAAAVHNLLAGVEVPRVVLLPPRLSSGADPDAESASAG